MKWRTTRNSGGIIIKKSGPWMIGSIIPRGEHQVILNYYKWDFRTRKMRARRLVLDICGTEEEAKEFIEGVLIEDTLEVKP